ncbi:MAG: hypothetical protein E5Y16_03690 [Mesorhizobium sp.]|nr:MAG: hypothetical protein EOS08_01760 [Mesorhizobium sp.]TJV46428.1 MAG: hypothetical protein E5Y16_03690 [Mesorhizobium sp.]
MADNRIILIAADIAMHKFHIAWAKAFPGCRHRHCLERSTHQIVAIARGLEISGFGHFALLCVLARRQNTMPSERGRSYQKSRGLGSLIGIVAGAGQDPYEHIASIKVKTRDFR